MSPPRQLKSTSGCSLHTCVRTTSHALDFTLLKFVYYHRQEEEEEEERQTFWLLLQLEMTDTVAVAGPELLNVYKSFVRGCDHINSSALQFSVSLTRSHSLQCCDTVGWATGRASGL